MATKKRRVPGLLRHSSGQARVCLSGQVHYCGVYGTAAAAQKYAVLLAEWEAGGRKPINPVPDAEQLRPVKDLFTLYEAYLDASGRYRKNGKETSQRDIVRVAVREFTDTFGNTPGSSFSERHLLQHRDRLEARSELTRTGINRKIGVLRAGLKWMFGRGLITRDQWLGTSAIEPLSRAEAGGRDRKQHKRAVSVEEIEKVAERLPRIPAAMLRLQALTGMRPGEVCAMRWADIDKNPVVVDGVECWTYRVANAKAEHHGRVTIYALASKARAILDGFECAPDECIFSPRKTMAEQHVERRALRKTPPTKQMLDRDAAEGREFADQYDVTSYRQAIERGIKKANVAKFTPHEVRHGFVTRAAQRFGVLAASVAANHSSMKTTETYLHQDRRDAFRVVVGLEEEGDATRGDAKEAVVSSRSTHPVGDHHGHEEGSEEGPQETDSGAAGAA